MDRERSKGFRGERWKMKHGPGFTMRDISEEEKKKLKRSMQDKGLLPYDDEYDGYWAHEDEVIKESSESNSRGKDDGK